jgi:hypothetical protein
MIEYRVEELSKLRTEDCTLKSLVFSQFTTMLSVVVVSHRRSSAHRPPFPVISSPAVSSSGDSTSSAFKGR